MELRAHGFTLSAPESTAASDIRANAQSFGRHLRAANKSPNTIKAYLDAAERLDAYLEAHGMPRAVAAIHREHVEAFVEDQLARLKPASAANRYRSLQQFFRWLVDEGEIKESPTARMRNVPFGLRAAIEIIKWRISNASSSSTPGRARQKFSSRQP
ncbi:MAG: phage integrase N-terminal SAM-like domain-containing protein [Chloroflexota bacterium]